VDDQERRDIRSTFDELVNMPPKRLEAWLESDESRSVGSSDGDEESVGHASGRRIVEILRTRKDDLSDDDYEHMRTVVNYIARHGAQGPTKSDPETSRWRYSLMNWGHDPLA
jgi:hypothetical protein